MLGSDNGMIEFRRYLDTTFPGLILRPNLYNQWNTGLHFGLGKGMYQLKEDGRLNLEMFEYVYSQALSIFNDIFSDEDDIFLVTNVYQHKKFNNKRSQIKVYNRYIKSKEVKLHLKQNTLPYVFDEEEEAEANYTSQFFLKCRKGEIRYPTLIQAVCNEDFSLKPKLGGKYGSFYPDVFFINTTRNMIFYIYDDRGCEVIANDKETLRPLYKKYNNLIYGNNREEIERLFK